MNKRNQLTQAISASLPAFLFFSLMSLGLGLKAQPFTRALSYDATQSDYVTLPANIVSSLSGDATLEAWVNWKGGSNNFPRIFDFGNDGNNWIALTAAIDAGSFGPRFAINNNGNFFSSTQFVDAAIPLTPNTWYHIAVSIEHATNTVRIYINGQLQGTNTNFFNRLSSIGNTVNNWIGRSQFPGDPYFDGIIDEVRISSVARYTGASFTVPAGPFTTDANTVVLYHFDEGVGQLSGNAAGGLGSAILGGDVSTETQDPAWIANTTLPVRLSNFSAQRANGGNAVDLSWTVQTDAATQSYIERSADGQRFTVIGSLSTTAIGSERQFTFRDLAPLKARAYYRIRLVEQGSAPAYTRILAVQSTTSGGIHVYPNPVKGGLVSIELPQVLRQPVRIQLRTNTGLLLQQEQRSAPGTDRLQFSPRTGLPKGVYQLEVRWGNEQHNSWLTIE